MGLYLAVCMLDLIGCGGQRLASESGPTGSGMKEEK